MPERKNELIGHIDKLPAFSTTVVKVLQLANSPKASPTDLIHAISLDPIMTAKALGLINSAYFGMREKVVSLKRAVIMLGFNTIKNIAIGSAVVSTIKLRNNYRWFTGEQFWEHSLGVGMGAKLIASRAGVPAMELDEYFIAGLLHDIGKVIFVQYLPDEHGAITDPAFEPGTPKTGIEAREFGINHAELGGLIAKKWELPPPLAEPIRLHHAPKPVGIPEIDRAVAAVHISDFLCNRMELGIKRRGGGETIHPEAYKMLGIDEKSLDGAFGGIEKMVEDARIFLKN